MMRRMTKGHLDLNGSNTSSLSPLRRKSFVALKVGPGPFSQNDDEAEILARRKQQKTNSLADSRNDSGETNQSSDRRLSIGAIAHLSGTELVEQYNQCIKLSAENKINVKNAFGLQLIDFMSVLLKKQDPQMNNLQSASRTLDASTKIYGFRVDSIYVTALKMAGALNKQDKNEDNTENQDEVGDDELPKQPEKVKKKRSRQKILTTQECLHGSIDRTYLSSSANNDDTQTADMLCLVSLPIHARCGFAVHLFNDVTTDCAIENDTVTDNGSQEVPLTMLDDIEDLHICSTLLSFDFLGWSEDDVPELTELNRTQPQLFDMDASIDHNDNDGQNEMNYFTMDDESQENVQRCGRELNSAEHVVDFQNTVAAVDSKVCEYSYVLKNISLHWAGPNHWKPRSLFRKLTMNKEGVCPQEPMKKKKDIVLEYTDEITTKSRVEFTKTQNKKIQSKTLRQSWSEEKITLPEDVHYDVSTATKYYYHKGLQILVRDPSDVNATIIEEDIANYNYGNENDTQNYCPDASTGDHHSGDIDDGHDLENCPEDQNVFNNLMTQGLTGQNLVVAPKQVDKLQIQYSTQAKKIDMRRLKYAIWKSLTQNKSIESCTQTPVNNRNSLCLSDVNETEFADIYKKLPRLLDRQNTDALSPALAFASLLHLANEKALIIESHVDMSNLHVLQG